MKAISQLFLNLFIILSISFMTSCLSINPPDDPPNIDDIDFSGLIDDESYGESVTETFTGDDLQLDFDNGTSFKLNATENKGNENQKVSVAIINDERFFNLEGDIVFDFSDNETEFIFDLEFSLHRNLAIDDITLCIYSKANSVDEMDAQHIAFTYDASKGLLKAKFRAPSDSPFNDIKSTKAGQNKKGRYDRLVISYVKFEESIVSRRLIPMPFYEQPGGTCWATCANMLSRAYLDASKTLRQPRIIDVVKSMGHQDLNSGVGLYDFKKVSGILKNTTFYDFETSSFFSSKSMLSHIIKKIDKNIPVVLKFDYPNVGSHVILVVGYEIDVMDNKPENTRLCYHDPRNDGNKGMYLVATYEWLMSQKSYTEVFQTLSAVSEPVPESKTLQTIGMPIFYDTQLAFANGHIGFYEENKFTSLPQVRLTYDKSTSLGYSWNHFKGNTLMTQIEDNASHIALSLPIYNASDVNKNLQLSIKAYSGKGENSTVVYETQKSITLEKKSTYVGFNENIPLSKIFAEENQYNIFIVENVYPKIDYLNVEPTRAVIQDVFQDHIIHAPGMKRVREMVQGPIIPTPGAVMEASKLLKNDLGDLITFDVGGATTDLHSVTDGSDEINRILISPEPEAKRTVEGDLGVYVNMENIVGRIGLEDLQKEFSYDITKVMKNYKPIPTNEEERYFVERLTYEAAKVSLSRHAGKLRYLYGASGKTTVAEGKDLTSVKYIIATGGALTRLPNRVGILRDVIKNQDSTLLGPTKEARILVDNHYIMASLGVLSMKHPIAALTLMKASLGIREKERDDESPIGY